MRSNYPKDMPIEPEAKPLAKCPCGAIGKFDIDGMLCPKCAAARISGGKAPPHVQRALAKRGPHVIVKPQEDEDPVVF